jgi:hypothetical protein
METHRIDITPARRLSSIGTNWIGHNRYFVDYRGERIGEFRTPTCEASRYLLEKGLAAEADAIQMFRDGALSMSGNVGALAKLTIIENEKVGPIWGKYRPMLEGVFPAARPTLGRPRGDAQLPI